jgi:single-strand DNA-binding protein
MSKNLNHVIFTGNLGRDVELTITPTGKSVAKFSVGCSNKVGTGEKTEWFKVVAWEKLADICNEYLRKGSKVLIEGRL